MIQTGFESRVKVQQIVESQLPSFILDENPNASEFLKQYYISQEYQGGTIDIAENLDQYLKLDNLTPEVVVGFTNLSSAVESNSDTINVDSTKGFPKKYGLLKIDNEIITYTGVVGNTFTGCIRGFSGITGYHQDLDQEELVFSQSNKESHDSGSKVENLSSLFLQEFYNKIKYTIVNDLQKVDFTSDLNVGTFLKEAKSFYKTKGTDESFRILFNVLYNENPTIVNLERFLIKPSYSEYLRREVVIAEVISGSNPSKLSGQTIKKSTDENTSASISTIESFSRGNKTYYKLALFIGYNDTSAVEGNFSITPSTRTTLKSDAGSSVITVDSTIGFPKSGTIISGTNSISYTSKSINQFLGCSNVISSIEKNDLIISTDTYYGYEDGDTSKKVEFRFLGSLRDFVKVSDQLVINEGETIFVKNLGDLIENPSQKTYKEIFANSWVYNTSTRYEASVVDGSSITLKSNIDKSSLKVGDRVELLKRGLEVLVPENNNPRIIQISGKTVTLLGDFDTQEGEKYDLRRKINTAISSGVSIEYGNGKITSDTQNIYSDGDEYIYVASNSLPSSALSEEYNYRYNITATTNKASISSISNLLYNDGLGNYNAIGFSNNAPFRTGDKVYYQYSSESLVGLDVDYYYVQVLSDPKQIRLYRSRNFVGGSEYLTFRVPDSGIGSHTFILYSQKDDEIGVQKILKKFPLKETIKGPGSLTTPGTTGMLINGVEISNYKSEDKVYYGPLDSVEVLNGGNDYDVINLPNVTVSSGGALVQPVISGGIREVYVDSQDYDIDKILSVNIVGGNGSGAVLEPVLLKRFRQVSFDGRTTTNSGGINTSINTINFLSDHNFQNGEEIVYTNNGNSNLVIGVGSSTLINNGSYYVGVVNNTTIYLYESLSDYNSGTKIGFSTSVGTPGIHNFRTVKSKNIVSEVKVINGGSGYTNRKVIVSPSGISTANNTVTFKNHGFESGELVKYNFQTSSIGISTNHQYLILKIDDDNFKLCDAGIYGYRVITSNFERESAINFFSEGSGYQYFSYPEISVSINYNPVGFGTTTQTYQSLQVTPVVKGGIKNLYLYENGTGYGSTVLNYEDSPLISVENGRDASLSPSISNGQLTSVSVTYGGVEYYSVPELIVVDPTNSGSGAKLRAVISNGAISEVKVISAGIGYSSTTRVDIIPSGSDALFKARIRPLTVKNTDNETLLKSSNKLKYTVSRYFENLRDSFGESEISSPDPSISKIIGWAYDGNPIYGPFAYSDPENLNSTISRLSSGYVVNTSNVLDRPSGFSAGFFVEDYQYTNSGNLDEKNGRFAKTQDFPNGVYAYYATVDSLGNPVFPYFIGNEYQSKVLEENKTLNQSFDFASSKLLRNTFPYKVSDNNAGYDHFAEVDEIKNQKITVESVNAGKVNEFNIINSGSNYSVGDSINFDNTGTDGGGLDVNVSSLKGEDIIDLTTSSIEYDTTFVWDSANTVKGIITPNHILNNGDYVSLSGFYENLSDLNGIQQISVESQKTSLVTSLPSSASIGTTEIYVSFIPENVSIGSSIGIGTETLNVLNVFKEKNVLRVQRGLTGVSHSENSEITYASNSFIIYKQTEYFDSRVDDKVYFNPQESVGFGTIVGVSTDRTFTFVGSSVTRSIPTQSIYLENHPFKTNQSIVYNGISSNIAISTDGTNIISGGLPSNVIVINKGKNLIGLKTSVDSPDLFFHDAGIDSDYDTYYFESSYTKIEAKTTRIKSVVSVSTSHGLSLNDSIKLSIKPNLSVGIGTSTAVKVLYDTDVERILVNPLPTSVVNSLTGNPPPSVGIAVSNYNHIINYHGYLDIDGDGFITDVEPAIIQLYAIGSSNLSNGIDFPPGATRTTDSELRPFVESHDVPPTGDGSLDITGGGDVNSLDASRLQAFANNYDYNTKCSFSENHNLKTGDKVLFEGTFKKSFYVFKVDDTTIRLCDTLHDCLSNPPIFSPAIPYSTTSTNTISLINPQIQVIRNNNLVFDLSDSSLSGYDFKIYTDKEFENEFESTGSDSDFNVSQVGTALTITYDANIPEKLYYNIEQNGSVVVSDDSLADYSSISYVDSLYNNNYNVVGVGTTTFEIVLEKNPEKLNYTQGDCDTLEYTTTSKTAIGPIDRLKVVSSGSGYKKLPILSDITTTNGKDANIVAKSNTIGNIKEINIVNDEFEYPSDPTLQPSAKISSQIIVKDSNTIESVQILDGGKGYITAPDLIIVNSETREKIESGYLEAEILSGSGSIVNVNVISEPKGLPDDSVSIFAVNNDNGITIQRMESSVSGIFTCLVSKPSSGLAAFSNGEEVYVEGIQKIDSEGSGFNSEDYGYQFFTVDTYQISNPYDRVQFNISGLTTNTGIAKTIQDLSGSIISKDYYPQFAVNQKKTDFIDNEALLSNGNDVDLRVTSFDGYFLKVNGTYNLSVGDIITGKESGTIATIESVIDNLGTFTVDYSNIKNFGWSDNVGELNSDSQVVPDNDYYQNLSYTVKSSKEYKDLESPVFSTLHTSGLKNFADTKIDKTTSHSEIGSIDASIYLYDILDEKRVDSVYNFDLAKDISLIGSSSKQVELKTKNLVDAFIFKQVGSRVLAIDDISDKFSYFEDFPSEYLNILKLQNTNSYNNYLVRVTNTNNSEIQFTEVVFVNDGDNQFIVQKGNVHNSEYEYGSFDLYLDEFNDTYFRFTPVDPYDTDYDLKLVKNVYTSSSAGIGTTSIGFIDLISSNKNVTSGSISTIVSLDSSQYESLFATVQITDSFNKDINFVEIYVTHDGSNTYLSEYYFDSEEQNLEFSSNFIGSFGSNLSGGILSLEYTNTGSSANLLRSKVVGFGSTSVGVGTYRFITEDQIEGSERSVIYQSDYVVGSGSTTLVSLDKTLFNAVKSLVEVSIGSTKAIHQVMMVQDSSDVYIQQSAILSVSGISTADSALGIGTFGGNNTGSQLELTFTPNLEYSSEIITISALSECFYTTIDTVNEAPSLVYGSIEESIDLKFYNSINGDRINITNFDLYSDLNPIFVKKFNPQNSNVLNPATGTFSIQNHFFRNGEELIYTPKSSIIGIATTAMTYDNGGITGLLPSRVFAIVDSEDSFQISTESGGSAVTFTDLGGGNIHQFEMLIKNSKVVLTIDDLIQSPIARTGIYHTLSNSISDSETIFELSGISLINPADILKIGDEYAKVVNVGLGTTSVGPITNSGSINLVETDRGFVGSSASAHSISAQVDIYRGSFNIVENTVHFVDPPRGNPQIDKTRLNLDYETSEFNGRVFLRSDYSTNKIYDDVSSNFNGIGRTFTLQVGGANTSGLGTIGSNGIVLINGIFQQPSTDNNPKGNFEIIEQTSPTPGISSVVFSGVTEPNTLSPVYYTSDVDININETPRGGIIISYGSTPGLGFAPLVGASVTAIVGAGGTIAGITTGLLGGTYGSGYYGSVSIAVTETGHSGSIATITANVGAGGTLSFNIEGGGTGYSNPQIIVSSPSYENLPVIGVSRLGIGATTATGIGLSVSLKVGTVGETGVGATYFGVTDFEFSKIGYSFQRGDVFKPVGLVTDSSLSSPIHDFEITVLETYSDKFSSWEFGKLDYMDSISDLQDGERVTFPLFYDGELRSFEKNDPNIDLKNSLLIFINGILQKPGYSYLFEGGSSLQFTTPPKKDDQIAIYFYKGLDSDIKDLDVDETMNIGDTIQILSDNLNSKTVTQDKRSIVGIVTSDVFETELYSGPGVDDIYWKPLVWTKQKSDRIISGEVVSKQRDSIKSLSYPMANIIGDVGINTNIIFVDSVEFFEYETSDPAVPFDALLVDNVTVGVGSTSQVEYVEFISKFETIQGSSGNIVAIASTTIPQLAIEFTVDVLDANLQVGYPIYIKDTNVGSGVTSIISNNSEVIGVGTTYLDNIYYIQAKSQPGGGGSTGILTCYVDSNSNLTGIGTTGIVGNFSWGLLANTTDLERLNPISIGVTGRTVSGLSTYPVIMRRGGTSTLRKTGSAYRK